MSDVCRRGGHSLQSFGISLIVISWIRPKVASIVLEDSNGNPISGAAATSVSGVNYTLPSGTVPEPSSPFCFVPA